MTPKEYIKDWVKKLCFLFKDIDVKYVFDINSDYHIIMVSPLEIYSSNDVYIKLEDEFYLNFINEFPCENLLISEENELCMEAYNTMDDKFNMSGSKHLLITLFLSK